MFSREIFFNRNLIIEEIRFEAKLLNYSFRIVSFFPREFGDRTDDLLFHYSGEKKFLTFTVAGIIHTIQ